MKTIVLTDFQPQGQMKTLARPLVYSFILFHLFFSFPTVAEEQDWTQPIKSYVIDLFEARECTYSGGKYDNTMFAYRLFIPEQLNVNAKYPILVWTSGYGERGNDNVGQLMHLDYLFDDPSSPEKYQFFVLAMQNSPNNENWAEPTLVANPDEPSTILMEILDLTIKEFPIDVNKVYLSGVSSGGTAVWDIAIKYPNRFAALVPMASAGSSFPPESLNRIVHLPIWSFHCSRDPSTPPDNVRSTVATLDEFGGRVHLTEVDITSHNCWNSAFRDFHAMDWMLSHVRGESEGYDPGVVPWQWWHMSVLPALIALLMIVYHFERKHREQKTAVEVEHPSAT